MGKTVKLPNDTYIANDLYSTSERIVGKWIDGKPLYRRVIIVNNTRIDNATRINHNISNIDIIKDVDTQLKSGDNSFFSLNYYSDIDGYIETKATKTYIYFEGTTYFSASATRILYITIEYTKTTD